MIKGNYNKRLGLVSAFLLFMLVGLGNAQVGMAKSRAAISVATKTTKSQKKVTENSFQTPDFAFPQTVESNAAVALESALKSGDNAKALRAAIQITISKDLVSRDNYKDGLKLFNRLEKELKAPYSSVAYLLEAGLYKDIYNANSWQYNRRTLPPTPVPEDVTAWSREMFVNKVKELVDAAFAGKEGAAATSIDVLAPILTDSGKEVPDGLTVYDFMVVRGANLLKNFVPDETLRADYYLPAINLHDEKGEVRLAAILSQMMVNGYAGDENPQKMLDAAIAKYKATPYCAGLLYSRYASERANLYSAVNWKPAEGGNMGDVVDDDSPASQTAELRKAYSEIKGYVDKFPNCDGNESLRQLMNILTAQGVCSQFSATAIPGEMMDHQVASANTGKFNLLVVKMPDSFATENVSFAQIKKFGNVTDVVAVDFENAGNLPWVEKRTMKITAPAQGVYTIVASTTGEISGMIEGESNTSRMQTMLSTELSAIVSDRRMNKAGKGVRMYVVNARNLQPVKGAEVVFNDRSKKTTKKLKTNADGYVAVPEGNFDATVTYGKNLYKTYLSNWKYEGSKEKREYDAQVLTDLSIYHPGDTVQFVGVLYSQLKRDMQWAEREEVKVMLRDANRQSVDSLKLITDRFGRVEGKLQIPQTGMLGAYNVVMEGKRGGSGSTIVDVADYKSPTFYVETSGVANNYKLGQTVEVKGKVTTYSGMPVEGATVKYSIRFTPFFRYIGSNGLDKFGGEAKTGADGSFIIEFPTEELNKAVNPSGKLTFGFYSLDISATSPSGETQTAPADRFALGEAYSISADIPDKIDVDKTKGDQLYNVKVTDVLGYPADKKVYFKIAKDGKTVKIGSFESSGKFGFDFGQFASGVYKIVFSLDAGCKSTEECRNSEETVIVFRGGEKAVPVKTQLWLPETRIVVPSKEKKVKVKVGSAYPDSWLLMQVANCDSVVEEKWLEINEGIAEVDVKAPRVNDRVSVQFYAMRDGRYKMGEVEIIPAKQEDKVTIATVTFRDRLAPGAKESWKFRFSIGDEPMSNAPVAAVMSNKALNELSPFAWRFNPASGIYYEEQGLMRPLAITGTNRNMVSYMARSIKSPSLWSFPELDLYGYTLYGGYGTRGAIQYRMNGVAIRGAAANTLQSSEAADEVYVLAEAPMMKSAQVSSSAVKEESAADTDLADGGVTSAGEVNENETLREIECPLAFFMPALETDSNGEVSVDFEVPAYNGTWQFQIMGYTPDMHGAVKTLDAVAAKQVMVQMNAPRFVRTGDVVSIAAMLYNNSDAEIALGGKIEIFDPMSGKILKAETFDGEPTAVSASRSVAIEYAIPSDITCIGIRAYASAGGSSDGEQTVVPVYPCSSPVTESTPFYLAPGEKVFEVTLPESADDATVTLKYNDNPIWECVTALPEIAEPKSENALSLVYSLYGNAIGTGLAKQYPEIVEALKLFADPANSADSTLVSNLEKNAALKIVALNNTPWLRDASAETLRMQSLVKYADVKENESRVKKNLESLLKLQNRDGGWSWCKDMPSSGFITGRVLLHFAMLKGMGYLPEDALASIRSGVSYSDKEILKDIKEYKGKDYPYSSLLNYLYVRSFFSKNEIAANAEFDAVKRKALKAVTEEWKRMSIYNKATAAILLNREGSTMASREILESLSQYASVSKEKGMWFDNLSSSAWGWNKLITTTQVLEAYTEIQPKSANVDKLRQWLVVTKQTENWGSDRETAEVIHAILTSGTKWTVPAQAPKIYVNGELQEIDRIAKLTGCLTLTNSSLSGGSLKIERDGSGPAWGGVISQYVAPISEVKAAGNKQLSVEKRVYVVTTGKDGTVAKEIGSGKNSVALKRGDKVRITLTLSCDRDIEYVAVTDERGGCLEPADQISGYGQSDGVWMYKEVRNESTNLFIPFLGKGTHVVSYDCYVDRDGVYSVGIASAQSQYAPEIAAHSAGESLDVTP